LGLLLINQEMERYTQDISEATLETLKDLLGINFKDFISLYKQHYGRTMDYIKALN